MQAAGGGVLDEDRLGVPGGDPPQAEVVRGHAHDVLAQRALEVAVRADGLHVLDPVLRRRASAAWPARPRSPPGSPAPAPRRPPRPRPRARPPGAAGGSRSRRAGARCARRSCAPARSRARCVPPRRPPAARPRRRSASGCGIVDEQHADRARRAADRDRDQRLDPEGVGPPARDQRATSTCR